MTVKKDGVLKRRDDYFPTYQRTRCLLYETGKLEYFNHKTQDLVGTLMINNCILSRIQRRKRDRLLKEDPCVLSIYTQDYRLLIRLKADDPKAAQEWHDAFSAVMRTYDETGAQSVSLEQSKSAQAKATAQAELESESASQSKRAQSFFLPEDLSKKLSLHNKLVWKTSSLRDGVRVAHEMGMTKQYACLLVSCVMPGTPKEVMEAIIHRQLEWDEELESLEVLEEVGSNSRIERVKQKPYRVGPISMTPRDAVLKRFWGEMKHDVCGVTMQSVYNTQVEEDPNYVRLKVFMCGYLLVPAKDKLMKRTKVYLMSHMDPRGWLGKLPKRFSERICVEPMISRLLQLKDAMETAQFVSVDLDQIMQQVSANQDEPSAVEIEEFKRQWNLDEEEMKEVDVNDYFKAHQKGSMNPDEWCEVPLKDLPLRVRGKNYLVDKKKIECTETALQLVAVDLFETEEKVSHIASHSDSVVHYFPHDFTFVVHFQVPGPPFLSFVCYFVGRKDVLTLSTPFGVLLNRFLTGTDELRNDTFKIIPRAVDPSPWIVKKSVGETPAILGRKLQQTYFGDGETYFEIDVDVGSSRVAGGILAMVKGYAKTIAIDLAFLLEGKEEEHLPEAILGAVRLKNPVIEAAKPLLI